MVLTLAPVEFRAAVAPLTVVLLVPLTSLALAASTIALLAPLVSVDTPVEVKGPVLMDPPVVVPVVVNPSAPELISPEDVIVVAPL